MLYVVLVLVLVGVALWFIDTNVPMSPPVKVILHVFVVIVLLLWLARLLGVADLPLPRL